MYKGVGSNGIITDGLVFNIDAFNLKSYDTISATAYDTTKRNHICPLNNGVIFDGRSFEFDGIDDYIEVGNLGNDFASFTLDMWFNSSSVVDYKNIIDFNGGNTMLRIEQYTAPGYPFGWINLDPILGGYARMSISINLVGDGSFGIGGDCPGNITENEWNNLIISYQNSSTASIPDTIATEFDGFVMQRVSDSVYTQNIMRISGNHYATWYSWISVSGGTLTSSVYESTGTHSETYIISDVIHRAGYTYLIPVALPNGQTMSGGCDIDNAYLGINIMRFGDGTSDFPWESVFTEMLSIYPSLTMSLAAGTYSETYVVDTVVHSAPYVYLYDSAFIGASTMPSPTYSTFTAILPKFGIDQQGGTFSGYDRISGLTFSGNVCSIYLNRERLINQWIIPNGFVGYINNMRIGDGYDYSSRRFQGKIPNVSLYNRGLTPEEAHNNYDKLKWRFNG